MCGSTSTHCCDVWLYIYTLLGGVVMCGSTYTHCCDVWLYIYTLRGYVVIWYQLMSNDFVIYLDMPKYMLTTSHIMR